MPKPSKSKHRRALPPPPPSMVVEDWPITRPQPYPDNPRRNEATVAKVAALIREVGFQQPIVVDEQDVIIVGHTRLLAAQSLNLATVPVRVARGLTPAQVRAYRLADNRVGEDSTWDEGKLAQELRLLDGQMAEALTGFTPAELATFTTAFTPAQPEPLPTGQVTDADLARASAKLGEQFSGSLRPLTDLKCPKCGEEFSVDHPSQPAARLAGVRCEESPARALGLTTYETYKGETWGTVEDKRRQHFTFYPIYDWSTADVWTAIHAHGWPYCPLYDAMYQHGVPVRRMRVSNVHHETAVPTLLILQAIEPHTWDRLTERLGGANTVKHLRGDWFCPNTLPPMFKDWAEFRDHLLENLITDLEVRATMRRQFQQQEAYYADPQVLEELVRTEITCILVNDYHMTKLTTFQAAHFDSFKSRGAHKLRTGRPA